MKCIKTKIYINHIKKLFLDGLVSPLKPVITRQDEDVQSEIELKTEEKVTEVVKDPPNILDSSDLTRGLPVDFLIVGVL